MKRALRDGKFAPLLVALLLGIAACGDTSGPPVGGGGGGGGGSGGVDDSDFPTALLAIVEVDGRTEPVDISATVYTDVADVNDQLSTALQ